LCFGTRAGQYSTQIFALAVLLSSLFVYNQLGAIDEAALDRLALVSEVSRALAGKAQGKGAASSDDDAAVAAEASRFAPSFLWLLRDFYLDLSDEGRPITPREYLEAALRLAPGAGPAVASKNQARAAHTHAHISSRTPRTHAHASTLADARVVVCVVCSLCPSFVPIRSAAPSLACSPAATASRSCGP
jgi:hypothetical protein